MASQIPAKKNTTYTVDVGLPSQSNPFLLLNNPTVGSADTKVSKDRGSFTTTTNAATVQGPLVSVVLTAGEMNADTIAVWFHQASGSDWCDVFTIIDTASQQINDLMATSGYTAPANSSIEAIKAKTDNLPSSPAATGDAMTLTSGERTSIGTAVWATTARTLSSFGTLVSDIATAVWAAGVRTLTAFGFNVTLSSAYDAAKTAAQAGDAMTLTSGERTAVANALLDLAAAIDGKTPRQALRIIAASTAGEIFGAGTGEETFVGLDKTTTRLVVDVDDAGNRTNTTYS